MDAGCSEQTISKFMREADSGNIKAAQRLLAEQRRFLLGELHREQKHIDCLDYLVCIIEKRA